jgi:hypothetical protein
MLIKWSITDNLSRHWNEVLWGRRAVADETNMKEDII